MMSNLGQSIPRHDGPIKVTGSALYAGDRNLPSQLYAVFVNATIPAGRVVSIETTAALARVGVVRVLKASDMPRVHRKLDEISVPPLATRFMPMQSDDIVYEGQPVAMVLAESLQAAEAGAAVVRVRYERRPFVVPDTAPAADVAPDKAEDF
ncbi:hypothetical protein [Paraburkholderia aspalathi]|uniref:hypothetical protein n=1 Tax=Paraburkholderia aspalathi TaxID=1324617 RepID=UPI001BAB4AB1|nr:hypothetical protein [Paraburkholderia aspalathi]